jgi:hypothetical protein
MKYVPYYNAIIAK